MFALTLCTTLQAKEDKVVINDELVVTEGNPGFFFDAGAVTTFKIDIPSDRCVVVEYRDDTIQVLGTIDQYNENRGEDWVKDWAKDVEMMYQGIFLGFPLIKKEGKTIKLFPQEYVNEAIAAKPSQQKMFEKFGYRFVDESVVKYDMVLHLDTLDMGNVAAGVVSEILFSGVGKSGGAIAVGYLEVTNRNTKEVVCNAYLNRIKGTTASSCRVRLMFLSRDFFARLGNLAKKEVKKKK